jgi:hypothetical protein
MNRAKCFKKYILRNIFGFNGIPQHIQRAKKYFFPINLNKLAECFAIAPTQILYERLLLRQRMSPFLQSVNG